MLVQLGEELQDLRGEFLARVRASLDKAMRLSKTRRWGEVLLELRRSEGALRRMAGRLQELLWLLRTVSGADAWWWEHAGGGRAGGGGHTVVGRTDDGGARDCCCCSCCYLPTTPVDHQ